MKFTILLILAYVSMVKADLLFTDSKEQRQKELFRYASLWKDYHMGFHEVLFELPNITSSQQKCLDEVTINYMSDLEEWQFSPW